jgi:hypothetical protein
MIDRHDINTGQMAWALISVSFSQKPVPTLICFERLLPYQGFSYKIPGSDDIHETPKEAIFAETKKELVEHHSAKLGEQINDLINEQERLLSFNT